jgi:antitoxin VapB
MTTTMFTTMATGIGMRTDDGADDQGRQSWYWCPSGVRGKLEMPLSIKDEATERLALELARATGETVAVATRTALEERLRRVAPAIGREALLTELAAIRQRWSALKVHDSRSAEEIIGYDDNGLPG